MCANMASRHRRHASFPDAGQTFYGHFMKTKAGVLWGVNEKWSVEEIELDPPREGEILVEFAATGLCHSDHHIRTGDMYGVTLPIIGGHEGAGVVQEVGPGVNDFEVGDHIVTSFLPACGRCRWCATGRQNLCDFGANTLAGAQPDGTFRRRVRGQDVGALSGVGAFSPFGTLQRPRSSRSTRTYRCPVRAYLVAG